MKPARLAAICLLLSACAGGAVSPVTTAPPQPGPTARILLVGDVMLGRGVASVLENEPDEVFADVRHLLDGADFVGANLESPLTNLPHTGDKENALEADPDAAEHLSSAGFDLMSLPHNHATDAGTNGLLNTLSAVDAAGLLAIGAGPDRNAATEPTIVDLNGLSVGFLAFDATGVGTPAGTEPGVAQWDDEISIATVVELRDNVDVVIVSVHGGTEYLPVTDPGMSKIAGLLADAGADVMWGHGAHVVQPVEVTAGARSTVTATSLGNFLFDQSGPDRTTGAMLEVLVDANGVVAYRVGLAQHPDRRIEFVEWLPPAGDAAWLHDSWWTLTRAPTVVPLAEANISEFRHGDLDAVGTGDITGDGVADIVASFRRPHQATPFMELHPEVQWADASGRSAHLGVYDPDGLREIWVAGSVLMPVAQLAVCDGSLATVHDRLDDGAVVAGGAWDWNGFGFDSAPDIPGPGMAACADVDGDGTTEPVIINRDLGDG